MVRTCVDFALRQLFEIQSRHQEFNAAFDDDLFYQNAELFEASFGDAYTIFGPDGRNSKMVACWEEDYHQIKPYQMELMFLKMMMCCFATWDDTDANLRSILSTLDGIWEDLEEEIDDSIFLNPDSGKQDWDLLTSFLEGKIQQCKPLIVDYCHVLLDSSFQKSMPLPSDQTLHFLQDVVHNLEVLVRYKADAILPVRMIIDSLKKRLILSRKFFQLITAHGGINCEQLRDLEVCLHSFANDAAPLAFLLWANEEIEEIEAKINKSISYMREKISKPRGSDVTPLYLEALKAFKLKPSDDALLHGEVVAGFVDLHLGNLVAASDDDWRTVRDGLIFLLTFMTDPPEGRDQDELLALVCNQIDLLFSKCMYLILFPDVIMKEHFTMNKILSNEFHENLEEMMRNVKQLYVKIPKSLSYSFPRTNGLGFYDFLLQNLESWKDKLNTDTTFIPFAKNIIIKIEEELLSLRILVDVIFKLQKEEKEFEEIWLQVINLMYQTEHVINSCSVHINRVWYKMASLLDILGQIEEMKTQLEKEGVKRKLEEVGTNKMHYTRALSHPLESSITPQKGTRLSLNCEEIVVGLTAETGKIIDELIGGQASLAIISVIGMGGLGKTTTAKEVCRSKRVERYFHKFSLGSVSQVLNKRNFFAEILCGLNNCKQDKFDSFTEDDLAQHLWRCLSGRIYLIVVDDIWDIEAWNAIKSSFPDDKNGSRIIFTTRELKVALDAKSSHHNLRALSDDESLKLLYMRVFDKDDCSLIFAELGKVIVKNCKGLPLSIVVVSGLLARNRTSYSWWKEIAEATSQFVRQECRDIIRYSYNHLPEHLKSCFLYMGIYGEDESILARKLGQLWIGEGFVNKSTTKSLRIVAKEYLRNLVDRNLVTVVQRTCGGWIQRVRLHDLIGDFCRQQAEEENFLWRRDGYTASDSSNSMMRNRYRICTTGFVDDVEATILENAHSLICWDKNGIKKILMDKLKLVQVLHLEGEADFTFFNHLIHLRYISAGQRSAEFQESICSLWNLETIIIKAYDPLKLPKSIWKMKRLRHLELPLGCEFVMEEDEDHGQNQLLENMEFLSVLHLSDERSPVEI